MAGLLDQHTHAGSARGLRLVQRMAAHTQFCHPGDQTYEATRLAIREASTREADERFVFVVSDAALAPLVRALEQELRRACTADPDLRCFNSPRALATSQHPWATVLTCSDSRVSPSWVFDTTPGDLFVSRNAGNTAFTEAIASIEYSFSVLKTPLLMVMDHPLLI